MDLEPYLNNTPRYWFFLTTGPAKSPAPALTVLLPILTFPGLSDRPRTIPESQEPVDEDDDEEDDEDVKEEEDAVVEDDRERFISESFRFSTVVRPFSRVSIWEKFGFSSLICRGVKREEEREIWYWCENWYDLNLSQGRRPLMTWRTSQPVLSTRLL